MMTIQTPNLVSTEHSHRSKIIIFVIVILIFISFVLCSCFHEDEYDPQVYSTPDSVEEVFLTKENCSQKLLVY